jgi:hypothetical protein|tara:strand:+ start:75 stop:389 length:315 start_codon:yes stop_codon:yes gene_type:complete
MAWDQETEEVYLKGVHNIIDKCEDLVDGGCMYDDEHITEKDILGEAINCMDEQSKKDFYKVLTKIEAEGYGYDGPTDDDGNPITEEEQERANHEQDRINKGEDD